jgi:hypothetical protein
VIRLNDRNESIEQKLDLYILPFRNPSLQVRSQQHALGRQRIHKIAFSKTVAKATTLQRKGAAGLTYGRALVVASDMVRYGAVGVDMAIICQCLGELGTGGLTSVLKSRNSPRARDCCGIGRWARLRSKSGTVDFPCSQPSTARCVCLPLFP